MIRVAVSFIALIFFYTVYTFTDINVAVLAVLVLGSLFAHAVTWNKVPIIPEPDSSIRVDKDLLMPAIVGVIALVWIASIIFAILDRFMGITF